MTIKHWIDGREVDSRDRFATLNPATGDVIDEVASGGEAEVDAACARRRKRFRNGRTRPRRSARS